MSGNPLAKLTWYVGVRQVASVYSTVDNYATAELALIPDQVKDFLSSTFLVLVSSTLLLLQTENGAHLRCEATNAALAGDSGPFVVSRVLNVEFPPSDVNLSIRPSAPKAGQNVTLTCISGSSRPASTIEWWYNGTRLEGATEMITEGGANGGFETTSTLLYVLKPENHGGVVSCRAQNPTAPNEPAHKDIKLSVARKFCPIYNVNI